MRIAENDGIEEGQAYKDSPVFNKPIKLMGPLNDAMAEIHGHVAIVPHRVEIDGKERIVGRRVRTDLPKDQLMGHARTYFRWMTVSADGKFVPK